MLLVRLGGPDLNEREEVVAVKYGMDLAGYEEGPGRKPLAELTENDATRVEKHYTEIKANVPL